jgi:hypothetical protein
MQIVSGLFFPCLLVLIIIALTEAQVQKDLAEEEESRIASGGVVLHETSPSAFLVLGLELEDAQYALILSLYSIYSLTVIDEGYVI